MSTPRHQRDRRLGSVLAVSLLSATLAAGGTTFLVTGSLRTSPAATATSSPVPGP